jgi:hypothetical protein
MPAGNVGYSDTRSFSGSLLADIASGLGNRIKGAAQMAREERGNAAKQLNVGGRDDGITQKEFDEEYGKGHFFKRALGSYFGGDRIARTRGYFEKNPPAGRDPTGSRESRFSAGFDYAAKEGLIKSARPLQGPIAPEYLYSYDKRYADVLGDAAKFKDDTLDKDKVKSQTGLLGRTASTSDTRSFGGGKDKNAVSVEDKELNEKIASSLSGIEIQMTKLESKMNSGSGDDGEVASLVSANSKAIVAGFTGIHAALSSLLGSTKKQTEAIRIGSENKKVAEEKAQNRESALQEESAAEGLDGGAGNASIEKSGNGDSGGGFWGGLLGGLFDLFSGRGRMLGGRRRLGALGRLGRMKAGKFFRPLGNAVRGLKGAAGGIGGSILLDMAFPDPAGGYDQLRGPNAYYNRPGYSRPKAKFYGGGAFSGGNPTTIQVGDTPKGVSEAIIPLSPKTYADSAKAKLDILKKNKKLYSDIQATGMEDFFGSPRGWKGLATSLFDAIKGLFSGGSGGPGGDPDSPVIDYENLMPGDISTMGGKAAVLYEEFKNIGYTDEGAKRLIAEIGREGGMANKNLFGTHTDPAAGISNTGMISWNDTRREKLIASAKTAGVWDEQKGQFKESAESLRFQARFMANEIPTYKGALDKALRTEGADAAGISQMLRDDYIVYRADSQYSGGKDAEYGSGKTKEWYNRLTPGLEKTYQGNDASGASLSQSQRDSRMMDSVLPGFSQNMELIRNLTNQLDLQVRQSALNYTGINLTQQPSSNPLGFSGSSNSPKPNAGISWMDFGAGAFTPTHQSGN